MTAVMAAYKKLKKADPKATLTQAMKEAKKTYKPKPKKWLRIRHTGSKYWGVFEEEEYKIILPIKIPKQRLLNKSVKVAARH